MIINDIELKRKDLIQTALQFGLNSIETIERSQELDTLLYQEIKYLCDKNVLTRED